MHADLKRKSEGLSGRLCKTSAEISYPYQGKQGNGGEVYAFGIIAAR